MDAIAPWFRFVNVNVDWKSTGAMKRTEAEDRADRTSNAACGVPQRFLARHRSGTAFTPAPTMSTPHKNHNASPTIPQTNQDNEVAVAHVDAAPQRSTRPPPRTSKSVEAPPEKAPSPGGKRIEASMRKTPSPADKENASWPTPAHPTRDLVHLAGDFDAAAGRVLLVNEREIQLHKTEFLVLLVLFCHSLKLASIEVPLNVSAAPYLSAKCILDGIDDYLRSVLGENGVTNTTAAEIIRAISDIRKKLIKARLNPNLIDSGNNHRGYRLGTAAEHVCLTYIDPQTGKVTKLCGK